MKILAAAFCAICIAMLSPSASQAQPPKFRVEIQPGQRGPSYTITNLNSKPVSAFVLEISSSSRAARKEERRWDSILEGHPPIAPGAGLSRSLYELAFSPTPDRIKVIAAIFTDGDTFGPPALINYILKIRGDRAAEYEDAARILQQGLSNNWTRDQYEQAFRDKPDSGAVYTVRTALSSTLQTAKMHDEFTRVMQILLKNFQQLSKKLREVKPI